MAEFEKVIGTITVNKNILQVDNQFAGNMFSSDLTYSINFTDDFWDGFEILEWYAASSVVGETVVCKYDSVNKKLKIPYGAYIKNGPLYISMRGIKNSVKYSTNILVLVVGENINIEENDIIQENDWLDKVQAIIDDVFVSKYDPQYEALFQKVDIVAKNVSEQQQQIDDAISITGEYRITETDPVKIQFKKANGEYGKVIDLGGNLVSEQELNSSIGSVNDTLQKEVNRATQKESELSSRIDSFTTLEEGSTTGDAELIDGRVGYDGKTYKNIGGAIRGQVSQLSDDIYDLKNAKKYFSVSVFELAESIENVFKNVVFNNANTEFDYLSNIVKQIKPEGLVSIKYSIKNCTINTSARYLFIGDSFTATITPNENTEFQGITVTMNGEDVTEIVVSDKTINISEVTGDILIVATSKSLYWADGYEVLNYVYSSGTGDAYIDTDWIMTDLGEKIVVGVQLSETNPTSSAAAFLGVNADSAFSSIYSAIELGQRSDSHMSIGWGNNQPRDGFNARHQEDFKSNIHYVSLTNSEQKLWNDEDMNSLYTGTFAINTQTYTMDDSKIPPFPVWLFRSNIQDVAYNSANKKNLRSPGVKISCFKVYDADGTLVVNMRASKRSFDGAIGFYDTVRQRFFENVCETGELIGG